MSATRYKKPHVDILIGIEMTRERNLGIKKNTRYILSGPSEHSPQLLTSVYFMTFSPPVIVLLGGKPRALLSGMLVLTVWHWTTRHGDVPTPDEVYSCTTESQLSRLLYFTVLTVAGCRVAMLSYVGDNEHWRVLGAWDNEHSKHDCIGLDIEHKR